MISTRNYLLLVVVMATISYQSTMAKPGKKGKELSTLNIKVPFKLSAFEPEVIGEDQFPKVKNVVEKVLRKIKEDDIKEVIGATGQIVVKYYVPPLIALRVLVFYRNIDDQTCAIRGDMDVQIYDEELTNIQFLGCDIAPKDS